jgi:hypothetical protein
MQGVTMSGWAASIEFRITGELVEVWHREQCRGAFGPGRAAHLVGRPGTPFTAGDVEFSLDRMVVQGEHPAPRELLMSEPRIESEIGPHPME